VKAIPYINRNNIARLLGVQSSERPLAVLLFIYSFFSGILLSFYYATANTTFIKEFGTEQIPYAFMVSGILGFVLIKVFSYFQQRYSNRKVYTSTWACILILMILFLLTSFAGEQSSSISAILAFTMFAFVPTVFGISGLLFSGFVIHLFDLRQGKRLFALLGSGEIFAAIIGYFSIRHIIDWIGGVHNLLFIAIFGAAAGLFVMTIIYSKARNKQQQVQVKHENSKTFTVRGFLKNGYFRNISIVIVLSTISGFFADFGFLGSVKLAASEEDLVAFIALFYGIVKVGELLTSVLSGRMLAQLGMKYGLSLLPLLMLAFTICAMLIGAFMHEEFMLLFLFFALARFCDIAVRKSVEKPSRKLLYQPLPNDQKIPTQTMAEGTMKQIGIAVAGGLLILINLVFQNAVDDVALLVYFSIFFALVLLGWSIYAFRLFGSYREQLKTQLESTSFHKEEYVTGNELVAKKMEDDLQENKKPSWLSSLSKELNLKPVSEKEERFSFLKNETLSMFVQPSPPHRIFEKQQQLIKRDLTDISSNSLYLDIDQPIMMIPVFGASPPQRNIKKLYQLLEDKEQLKKTSLVEMLQEPETAQLATQEIIALGDDIIEDLELLFARSNDMRVALKIMRIYGAIGTEKAKHHLLERLLHSESEIKTASINALHYCKYHTDDIAMFRSQIEETIGVIVWLNASMFNVLQKPSDDLIDALVSEQNAQINRLFILLGFIYSPQAIELIRKQLLDAHSDSDVFALELIDNYVGQEFKQSIIPLFENSNIIMRLRKLRNKYPQKRLTYEERLTDILNYNFASVGIWVKACALYLVDQHAKKEIPKAVISCLYHPHPLLYELAAIIILKRSEKLFEGYLQHLPKKKKRHLSNLLDANTNQRPLFYTVKALKKVAAFRQLTEQQLISVSLLFQQKKIGKAGRSVGEKERNEIYVLLNGGITMNYTGTPDLDFYSHQLIMGDSDNPHLNYFLEEETNILVADKAEFFDKIMEDPLFADPFVNSIQEKDIIQQ
jgi:predicted MFS family arabinose efflux permease